MERCATNSRVVDIRQVRSDLKKATDIIKNAILRATKAISDSTITVVRPGTVRHEHDIRVTEYTVRNADPYAYKKTVRRWLEARGEPIPDHLYERCPE